LNVGRLAQATKDLVSLFLNQLMAPFTRRPSSAAQQRATTPRKYCNAYYQTSTNATEEFEGLDQPVEHCTDASITTFDAEPANGGKNWPEFIGDRSLAESADNDIRHDSTMDAPRRPAISSCSSAS
jgi:hypothetical protein